VIVIPAVDLKDGRCVRLSQGRMDRESVYSEDPIQMAGHWESKGAERLHVIDLNGAITGTPFHQSLIREIAQSLHIPLEVGGGIRDLKTIQHYIGAGVRWVILGTSAFLNPSFVREACRQFPEKIILAIDAKEGRISIKGWQEMASIQAIDSVRQFEDMGLSSIIYTDIERDGMETGLNWEMTRALALTTSIPVIASGGVSRIGDIEHLLGLETDGIMGVIVGRALYTGRIDLEEAIRLCKKVN
jgi:phosphoribosylformimino-5-aminoimidazole carboxamide ribotide isomerase